jgi:hypothetical protein
MHKQQMHARVAANLGITPERLKEETVEQLALEKGISADQLRTLIGEQLEQRLTAALQSGSLSAEQAAQIRARHQTVINNLMSGQPRRGPGRNKPAQS